METSTLKSMIMMLPQMDLFSKLIVLIIVIISIYSWAIMIRKYKRFRLINQQSEKIINYAKGRPALQVLKVQIKSPDHPLAKILNIMRDSVQDAKQAPDPLLFQEEISGAIESILEYEERHIDFLATTSSASPFLGLLGTVWGIVDSFWQIGLSSSANIAVVAPGLSEALITTVFGIIAAVPAFFGFNYCRGQMRHLEGELESFAKTMVAKIIKEMKVNQI